MAKIAEMSGRYSARQKALRAGPVMLDPIEFPEPLAFRRRRITDRNPGETREGYAEHQEFMVEVKKARAVELAAATGLGAVALNRGTSKLRDALGRMFSLEENFSGLAQLDVCRPTTKTPAQGGTSRRNFLRRTAVLGAAGAMMIAMPAYGMAQVIDPTKAPYNADPTGRTDSAPAFQAALNQIAEWGSGVIIPGGGRFILSSPLTLNNANLTIIGYGQATTLFVVTHKATALTVTCQNNSQCVTLRDLGFAPVPNGGGAAGVALDLSWPNMPTGWQHCSIENVDLGPAQPNYTTFIGGINFTNVWRSTLRNVNFHSNIGVAPNSYSCNFNGMCVDNIIEACKLDGIATAVAVNSYSEGLHIVDSVLIGNLGFTSGTTSYSGNGVTTPFINLLGLYISNCEINCRNCALNLFQVAGAWITSTHCDNLTSNIATIGAVGCLNVHIIDCSIAGQFNKNSPAQFYGIAVRGSSNGAYSDGVFVDNCEFENLQVGVYWGIGAINCSTTALRFFEPGLGALLSGPITINGWTIQPILDNSMSKTNVGQWISTVDGANNISGRFLYNQK